MRRDRRMGLVYKNKARYEFQKSKRNKQTSSTGKGYTVYKVNDKKHCPIRILKEATNRVNTSRSSAEKFYKISTEIVLNLVKKKHARSNTI